MKVIDKLVDIANNGENSIIEYFRYYNRNDNCFESCLLSLEDLIYKLNNGSININDDIGIYYTPKKYKNIEKLPKNVTDNACISKDDRLIATKINEIIDFLNGDSDE